MKYTLAKLGEKNCLTAHTAQKNMFSNVAHRATAYKTGTVAIF